MTNAAIACNSASQRFIAMFFIFCGLFFAGAFAFDVFRAAAGDVLPEFGQPDRTLLMVVWMAPILVLSGTSFITAAMLNRYASGSTLIMANAVAIRWISIGIVTAGGIESISRLVFEMTLPEVLELGGKEHLYMTVLIAFGSMLGFLATAMKSAARLQEEHDHIL